jgi:hypothetical protein
MERIGANRASGVYRNPWRRRRSDSSGNGAPGARARVSGRGRVCEAESRGGEGEKKRGGNNFCELAPGKLGL